MAMDKQNIDTLHKRVESQLQSKQVFAALSTLREMLSNLAMGKELDSLKNIEDTYSFMTHYLLEGARDDNRETLLTKLIEEIRTLSDRALRQSESQTNSDYYYSTLRFNSLRKESLSLLLKEYGNVSSELSLAEAVDNDTKEMRKHREDLLERLFNSLLVSLGDDNIYSEIVSYINSGYADQNIANVSLSAITLSLLHFYDRGKFKALLDFYESNEDESIKARALTGIVIAMVFNSTRIASDKEMTNRLSLWNDSLDTYRRLRVVIRSIISARDTQRVVEKMKTDVLPEIMKLQPEIMDTLKNLQGDIDSSMLENNPEWEELLEKSNLSKKMEELADLQSDGADFMMVTFANLKQFPFFNSASNWFLPFDISHTQLNLDKEMEKFLTFLIDIKSMICDSDLYSLALSASMMPDSQKKMISAQFASNLEQLQEAREKSEKSNTAEFDTEVIKSTREFYRFFKLFRKRDGFKDPFERPLDFLSMPTIGDMMHENEILRIVGEFYFKRGYYHEALPLLNALAEDETDDSTLYEKIGFCHQSEKHFAKAKESYEKAALLKTPGFWLTGKLAYVCRRLGKYEEAAEHYTRALEMDPDNVTLLMNAGNMLLEIGDISAALTHFYHANYVMSDTTKIMRAVAWAEMLNGNYSKSKEYYNKVLLKEAQSSDYLNAGHVSFLLSEYKEAVKYYRMAAKEDSSKFELEFNGDISILESQGANRDTLMLIYDIAINGK